jgi:hypothetical protein
MTGIIRYVVRKYNVVRRHPDFTDTENLVVWAEDLAEAKAIGAKPVYEIVSCVAAMEGVVAEIRTRPKVIMSQLVDQDGLVDFETFDWPVA